MRTTCKDIEPIMVSYVTDDILDSQRALLDEHLKDCEACAAEIIKMQKLDLDLIELREEESNPPEELKSTILSELKIKRPPRFNGLFSSTSVLSAVTVALLVLVFVLVGKMGNVPGDAVQKPKSVKVMFFSEEAKNVSLVGDFNGWGVEPVMLKNVKDGTWETVLKLSPGMYQYNLIVDGEKWLANPNSHAQVPDGFGGTNSVMIVNGGGDTHVTNVGKKI